MQFPPVPDVISGRLVSVDVHSKGIPLRVNEIIMLGSR